MENLKEAGIYSIDKETVDRLFAAKKNEENDVELHRARAGILGGFTGTKVMGIPVGAAGVGLLTVSAWDAVRGLVSGKLPANIPAWLIPAGGAMVVQSKFIKPKIGEAAANAAGLILTVDAIQTLFNVRGLVSGLVNKVPVKLQQTQAAGGGSTPQTVDAYLKAQGLI